MNSEKPMPDFYKTTAGRVVSANPALHRMVVSRSGDYGRYAPCDEEGNVLFSGETEERIPPEQVKAMIYAAKEEGVEQGWAEAKEKLGAAIEEAKAEAFEAGRQVGMAESKPKTTRKTAADKKAEADIAENQGED